MTRAEEPGSGSSGPLNRSAAEVAGPSVSSLPSEATAFADLARPVGPFESVERLRILETLTYGVLYEGRVFQASRGQEVCLLELDPLFDRNPDTFARVLTGLMAASRMSDANALAPRGVFRHGESLYVLLDSLSGVSLATALEFLGRSGLRLSSEAVLRIASGVLAALDDAARSDSGEEDATACHGLLTPENIFIAEGQRVVVRGFGLWPAGIDEMGLLGPDDRRYLAPSQTRTSAASPRSDLLSLGIILFEALVGFPAFDTPAEEEDVAELRSSIGEQQAKAGPLLSDLYEVVLSILTPPASVTSAYRGRVRKKIDTLFLREFTRDRVAKTLSLEELVSRIKPRRPAIVKATPMSLEPAEAASSPGMAEESSQPAETAPPEDSGTVSLQAPPFVEEPSAPASSSRAIPPPYLGVGPPRRRGVSKTTWAFVAAAVAAGLFGAIFWSSWSRLGHPPDVRSETEGGERPVILPAPASNEAGRPGIGVLPAPAPSPPPTVASVVAAGPRESESRRARRKRESTVSHASPRRDGVTRRREPPARRVAPPESGTTAAPAASVASAPLVAPGALVPLRTPGLVAPSLIEKPPIPRYGESDPRPAAEHSASLEILVSDSGRVRGSRIVRADRMPAGFNEGVERYLAGLRFRPADLGGVPVKVWIPFELRFLSP